MYTAAYYSLLKGDHKVVPNVIYYMTLLESICIEQCTHNPIPQSRGAPLFLEVPVLIFRCNSLFEIIENIFIVHQKIKTFFCMRPFLKTQIYMN